MSLPQEYKLSIRTADQTRRAELALAPTQTGAEIIQSAVDHWALPADADYALVNVTQGRAVKPGETLDQAGVNAGDVLEVQPVLVAGGDAPRPWGRGPGGGGKWGQGKWGQTPFPRIGV